LSSPRKEKTESIQQN